MYGNLSLKAESKLSASVIVLLTGAGSEPLAMFKLGGDQLIGQY